MVASAAPDASMCLPTGSDRSILPSSRRRITATATNVLLIEPARYCTPAFGAGPAVPRIRPRPADQMRPPPLTSPALTEGNRWTACSVASREVSSRCVY